MSDILYNPFWYSEEEIALLKEHDKGETLHKYRPSMGSPFCRECGDTEEGLMHNNTWRNVEPLIDLNACSNGCVCEEN
jgi:hypothetical protein